ncbi:formyltransferase family protein [Gammaproteobacteria bacterium]|nr:formyltransferase family protein [Gammaproteobacteria bacterium]
MKKKFLFVGNRFFVLEKLIDLGLDVRAILAIKGSYLERALIERNLSYTQLSDKELLSHCVKTVDFDILISNGCPYILNTELLDLEKKVFVNIHPSFLPDLRGADPQPGALLSARDSGATCHLMEKEVDSGPVISRKRIPYSEGFDSALLYQLTFRAETQVFVESLKRNFEPKEKQSKLGGEIYYSFKENDLDLSSCSSAAEVFQKIKAFSNRSKGARFIANKTTYKVFDCEIFSNEFLSEEFKEHRDFTVLINYENKILTKLGGIFIKLKDFDQDISSLSENTKLA